MTVTGKGKIMVAGVAVAAAGLLGACGGSSSTGPAQSASPPVSASPTATGLAEFRAVATGPLAQAVKADAVRLSKDAGNLTAAEADARKLAADLAAWASALRAASVPPSYQATKDKLLSGLDRMRKGVGELADGLRSHDSALIAKGEADVRAGVVMISQAGGTAP